MSGGKGAETDRKILEVLAKLDGVSPGELYKSTGIAERTVRAGLGRLEDRGLIERTNAWVTLTIAGRAAAAPSGPATSGDALDAFFDELLPPWHAAWARLLADAIVSRRLFPRRRSQPCFVAYGPTGTAKSLTVTVVCRSLGLDDGDHIALLSSLAPGELLGRRTPIEGGRFGFIPAPRLADPVLCLDEFANADGELRREALKLLQGDPVLRIEDARVDVAPVPVVLFNPPANATGLPVLPLAIYRRAITLDTFELRQLVRDRERAFARFMGSPAQSFVDLERVVPVLTALSEECADVLRLPRSDSSPLTAAGQELWHPVGLEHCAIGRAARWALGAHSDRAVVATVVQDALLCAETVANTVHPGWRESMEGWEDWLAGRPGAARFTDVAEHAARAHGSIQAKVRSARMAGAAEDLVITERRAALRQELVDASKSILRVPEEHRVAAAAFRAALKRLAERAGDARSLDSIDDLAALAAPRLEEVARLRSKLDQEQRARMAEAAQQRADDRERVRVEREAKRQGAAARKAARDRQSVADQERRRRRAAVTKLANRKRTRDGENVAQALIDVGAVTIGYVDVERPGPLRPIKAARARLRGETVASEAPTTVSRTVLVDLAGRSWWPGQLTTYESAAVQTVLAAALQSADQDARASASAGPFSIQDQLL